MILHVNSWKIERVGGTKRKERDLPHGLGSGSLAVFVPLVKSLFGSSLSLCSPVSMRLISVKCYFEISQEDLVDVKTLGRRVLSSSRIYASPPVIPAATFLPTLQFQRSNIWRLGHSLRSRFWFSRLNQKKVFYLLPKYDYTTTSHIFTAVISSAFNNSLS